MCRLTPEGLYERRKMAAAMDTIGGIVATLTIPTDTGGFQQLLDWAASFGWIPAFGDLAALLAQDPADRLDRVALAAHGVDEPHDRGCGGRGSRAPAPTAPPLPRSYDATDTRSSRPVVPTGGYGG